MSTLIESLRQEIDAKHEEAVRALKVLEVYLQQSQQPTLPPSHMTNGARQVGAAKQGDTIIDRVLGMLTNTWTGTKEIKAATGLRPRQIRGVLNRPGVREKIEKKEEDGRVLYRLRREDAPQ
jgi:hypothetical protein